MKPETADNIRRDLTYQALIRSQGDLNTIITAKETVKLCCDKLFPMIQATKGE